MRSSQRDSKELWVTNNLADEVVSRAQKVLREGIKDSAAIQKLMDLVSGVQNYSMFNPARQGVIKRIFEHERIRYRNTRTDSTSNFSIDFEDVASTFWEHVFLGVEKATLTGTVVPVRVVEGLGADNAYSTRNGMSFANRQTKCNPIHYLRKVGIMGARNLINATYRKSLIQACEACGRTSTASRSEIKTPCPKCKSEDIRKDWPDKSCSYGAKKVYICNQCNCSWNRQFKYVCAGCKSTQVQIETRYRSSDDSITEIASTDRTAEGDIIEREGQKEYMDFIDKMYNFLPNDPTDPGLVSKTKDIFSILVSDKVSQDVCRQCVNGASQVCREGCKAKDCDHEKMPNPKVSCGQKTFCMSRCVNFSKKLGEYQNCSASLTARRIKKIRQYFIRFIKSHRDMEICEHIYTVMKNRNLITQYA